MAMQQGFMVSVSLNHIIRLYVDVLSKGPPALLILPNWPREIVKIEFKNI